MDSEAMAMSNIEIFNELWSYIIRLKQARVKGWESAELVRVPERDEFGRESDWLVAREKFHKKYGCDDPSDITGADAVGAFRVRGRRWYVIYEPDHALWLKQFRLGFVVMPYEELWEDNLFIENRRCSKCGSRWVFANRVYENEFTGGPFMGCRLCGMCNLEEPADQLFPEIDPISVEEDRDG